ncbi:GDSL-type esterase/lipase family protein [Nocardia sp. NPDC051570]|uniref:glycoside hydrolase family 130 protein n=1 Tax=Nocardia sp. NPDC051570 TaxID=3364324 RepID=UPI0037B0F259
MTNSVAIQTGPLEGLPPRVVELVAAAGLTPGLLLENLGVGPDAESGLIAQTLGLSGEQLETIRAALRDGMRTTAAALAAEPEFAAALDRLPFTSGQTVIVAGDSLTAAAYSWANLLGTILAERGVRLVNRAVSGRTTTESIPAFKAALALDPDWVIIMLGANDSRREGITAAVRMTSVGETARNLAELERMAAEQSRAKVIVIPSFPVVDPASVEAKRGEGDFWYPEDLVASRRAVLAAIPGALDVFSDLEIGPGYWSKDGTHPSEAGQQVLLRAIVAALGTVDARVSRPRAYPPASFPLGPFTPYTGNPILQPTGDGWQSANLYNPAAIVIDDRVALLYRGHAADKVSHIGIAFSDDGIHFEREDEPLLSPEFDYERHGCEDPRITRIGDTYYLTYTGHAGDYTGGPTGPSSLLCLATSTDLRNWTKHGPLFPDFNTWGTLPYGPEIPWNKAGVIHSEPIDGKYYMYFGEGCIYYATSEDLLHWTPCPQDEPIHTPTPGNWDGTLVEIGAPPVTTADGLLVFLTNSAAATSPQDVDYRCGQIAIAPNDPTRVIAKTTQPWLRPESFEDTHGMVANVTFVEGLVHFRGIWFAYYGQSDTTLAVAIYDPTVDSFRP